MEGKLKHLEMIQSIVNRMASNSFFLKGWSVTLVSALFALSEKGSNPFFLFVAYVPCICFWALDAYFLRQERLFRALYNATAEKSANEITFSMDTSPHTSEVDSWGKTAFSITLRLFHGFILFTIVVVTVMAIVAALRLPSS